MGTDLKSAVAPRAARRAGRWAAWAWALLIAAAPCLAATPAITGDHRLFHAFVEDGAIVQAAWIEMLGTHASPEGGRDVAGGFRIAYRLGGDGEVGASFGLLDRRREAGAVLYGTPLAAAIDERGWADPRIFAKYRLVRSPLDLAVGASVVLPLADEEIGLGSGTTEYSLFLAGRHPFQRAALVWRAGASDRGAAGGPGGAPGRTAPSLGAALLAAVAYQLIAIAEIGYEGARFEGDEDQARVLAGLDWRPTENTAFRGAIGRGLSEGAPQYEALFSAAFHF